MRSYEMAMGHGLGPDRQMRLLTQVHAAFVEGRRPPAQPRRVIRDSWMRVRRTGLNPVRGGAPTEAGDMTAAQESDPARHAGAALLSVSKVLSSQLGPLLDDGDLLLVIADDRARILTRSGARGILRGADDLGFRSGCEWSETSVGTNAIGTALVTGAPIHVHAAEHFCLSQHTWSCAAAPVRDPRTGQVMGAIDLSFPARDVHPSVVALATSLALQAELMVRDAHHRSLQRLRSSVTADPGGGGTWALVDPWGWVADSAGVILPERLALPTDPAAGTVVEGLGPVEAREVRGGWLLVARPGMDEGGAGSEGMRVHLDRARCEVAVGVAGHTWNHVLVGRRAAILSCLARHPEGLGASELAREVYGRDGSEVTARSEVHRIRTAIPGLVETRPYRLASGVEVEWAPGAGPDTGNGPDVGTGVHTGA